jgi:hypothetical protein
MHLILSGILWVLALGAIFDRLTRLTRFNAFNPVDPVWNPSDVYVRSYFDRIDKINRLTGFNAYESCSSC